MPNVKLCFLGTPQFELNEQSVTLTKAKGIALLVYLAITRTPQQREQVITLLWPDSLPQAARKNLRNTLWDIRKLLGEDVIEVTSDRLRLGQAAWVDIHAFEAIDPPVSHEDLEAVEQALALYRGPLAEGLNVLEAPAFELWLTTEREQLSQHYLRLLDGLIAQQRNAETWSSVIRNARKALAADNLQEPMYQALMEAHARLGERPEALRQYEALQAILQQELGVNPLPETEDLRRAILNGHIQISSHSAPATRTRQTTKEVHPQAPFVGRREERSKLDTALQQTMEGQTQVVLISGELGIGKSRLWQEWSHYLTPGTTILATRCLESTQALPFAPLTRLFSQSGCAEKIFTPNSPLPAVWLAELSRLFPQIKSMSPQVPAPAELPPEEERGRLFEAFTQVLQAMLNEPLIMFIDDVHWVDRATLDWLAYMVDRLHNRPLLLIGTYRPADASAWLTQQIAIWNREGNLHQLPLPRLNLSEASDLMTHLNSDTDRIEQLYAKSAGNPYFLIELQQASSVDTPPALADLIAARLQRLSGATRQVMQAAAILEAGFDFDVLRRTSGRGEEETLAALDELLNASVLSESDIGYEFSHPLVATVIRDGFSAARRQFLHRRAAEALAASHSTNPGAVAGRITAHYVAADKPVLAAAFADMAADYALSLAALDEAIMFYRQAHSLEPTPSRQMNLGRTLFFQPGAHAESRETLQSALAWFEMQGDKTGVVNSYLNLAFTYLPSSEGEKIIGWAERALPHLEAIDNPEAEAQAYFMIGAGTFRVGRSMDEAEALLVEARKLATTHHLPEIARMSWFESGNLQLQRGDYGAAVKAFEQSFALGRVKRNIYNEVICYNNLAYAHLLAGNIEAAQENIGQGLDIAEHYSLLLPRQYLYSTRAEIAMANGAMVDAEAWFGQALEIAEKFNNAVHAANIRANLGLVAQTNGNLDKALDLLTTAQLAIEDVTTPHLASQIDLWLAELYLERGEPDLAQQALQQTAARIKGSGRKGLQSWARRIQSRMRQAGKTTSS